MTEPIQTLDDGQTITRTRLVLGAAGLLLFILGVKKTFEGEIGGGAQGEGQPPESARQDAG